MRRIRGESTVSSLATASGPKRLRYARFDVFAELSSISNEKCFLTIRFVSNEYAELEDIASE